MLVPCPWCGSRNAAEFRFVGECTEAPGPDVLSPATWRSYLYVRSNPAGWVTEMMYHRAGCRRYFLLDRHTVTNECGASRPPAAPAERPGDQR
jgi:heterotetrameric sarcosine oxidase delta subunit